MRVLPTAIGLLMVLLSRSSMTTSAFGVPPTLSSKQQSFLSLHRGGAFGANLRPGEKRIQQKDSHQERAVPYKTLSLAGVGILDSKTLKVVVTTVTSFFKSIYAEFVAMNPRQKCLVAAVFFVGVLVGRTPPFWKRYTEILDMPRKFFGPTAPLLRGRAISVSDGDTIRFLHQPTVFHATALKKGQKTSEFGLPIRICTIDTPETSKFGKPGQPFGVEAKEHLKELLENKPIFVRLLQKDQYARGVGQVCCSKLPAFLLPLVAWNPKLLSLCTTQADEYQLQAGLAEVYRGGGAVYGPAGLEAYEAMERAAQEAKLGIWSQKQRESAAEYKRRTK